ncbi:uncharacterized protein [Cherax quadricarinatus]
MSSVKHILVSAVLVCVASIFSVNARSAVLECHNHSWNSCQKSSLNQGLHTLGCQCDPACAYHGDCCLDAAHYRSQEAQKYTCVSLSGGGVHMKGNCRAGWQDAEVARLCEAGSPADISSSADPVGNLPVTSITSVTYTNYYCAICNQDSHNLTLWKVRLVCPSLQVNGTKDPVKQDSLRHLQMIDNSWGIYSDDNGLKVFHECNIESQAPSSVQQRMCRPSVGECGTGWRQHHIQQQCNSYTALVQTQSTTYKNLHCALCNNENRDNLSCIAPASPAIIITTTSSFGIFVTKSDDLPGPPSTSVSEMPHPPLISPRPRARPTTPIIRPTQIPPRPPLIPPRPTIPPRPPMIPPSPPVIPSRPPTLPPMLTSPRPRPRPPMTPLRPPTLPVTQPTRTSPRPTGGPTPFTILVDFTDRCGNNEVGFIFSCGHGGIWDIFTKKCRDITCWDKQQKFVSGSSRDGLSFTTLTTASSNTSFSQQHLNESNAHLFRVAIVDMELRNITPQSRGTNNTCLQALLFEHEYDKSDNGSLVVEKYDRVYNRGEYEVVEGGMVVCAPHSPTEKFSHVMGWMTLAGLGLSCLCLLLHLAAFLLVPHFRNLPGKSMASLCLSLLTAYTIFIVSTFVESGTTGCYILAALMYYSFLASFCWMSIIAFDVWQTIRQSIGELRVSSGKQKSKFLAYSVYSWLLPALAVFVTVALDQTAPAGLPSGFLPSLGQRWCWFGQRKALLVFFAVPLLVVMVLNAVFFLATAYVISTSKESMLRISSSSHYNKRLQMYVRLAVLMGLTWITGIVAGYLQLESVWYIFVVLNTLQGVFIFLAFTCRSNVLRAVRKFWQTNLPSIVTASQVSVNTESTKL